MIPTRVHLEISRHPATLDAQARWQGIVQVGLRRQPTLEIRELATLSDVWNLFSLWGGNPAVYLNYATLLQTRRDPTYQDNLAGIAWENWVPRGYFSPHEGLTIPIYCPNPCPQDDIYLWAGNGFTKVAYVGP